MPSVTAIRRSAATLTLIAGSFALWGVPPAAAAGGTISGVAFKDVNRDGVKQSTEEPLAGKYVYLFDQAGTYLRNALTDASGAYVMADLAPGTYRVDYGRIAWTELWHDWAPSTTGSIRPSVTIQLSGSAVVDFGFRPIVRSTDMSAPITTFRASSGLTVNSYNDVVTAQDVYAALMQGSLLGNEMATTTIGFDTGSGDFCLSNTSQVDGRYQDFSASCSVDFLRWLDVGDQYLFHEHGHAWGVYNAYINQQDPSISGYLVARGIDPNDPRLGTTHAWSRHEMLAEDYRTLFGSPTARVATQENTEIPPAASVPGLANYLSTTFMTPASSPPPPPPPPPAATAHVDDLDGSAAATSRNWTATVQVGVEDSSGSPVTGAAITVNVPNGKQGTVLSCTTGTSGRCAVSLSLGTKTKSATFTVTNVNKTGSTYVSSANADPDGDSNGTSILVAKPA